MDLPVAPLSAEVIFFTVIPVTQDSSLSNTAPYMSCMLLWPVKHTDLAGVGVYAVAQLAL
jgi:hypothetical protein